MVHGVGRAASWLFSFSLNLASKIFTIRTRYNCLYKGRDLLKALTYLSLDSEYAEGRLKALAKGFRRHYKPGEVLDAGTFLYRLKKLSRSDALAMLRKMNEEALCIAKRRGCLQKKGRSRGGSELNRLLWKTRQTSDSWKV